MALLNRIINAVRGDSRPPRPGMLLRPRKEDALRDYPADGLTPQRLISILRDADAGALSAQMELFEQMEEKDAHLFSVANTRRLAVTGLPWEIVSAAELPGWSASRSRAAVSDSESGAKGATASSSGADAGGDTAPSITRSRNRAAADAAAAYCDDLLRNTPGFEESLVHLTLALGRNIALVELVWDATPDGLRLVELAPVDFGRIVLGDLDEVRILTDDDSRDGVEPPPDKFIIHTPHAAGGHPSRGGLLRVTALAYLAKHFAIKDWLIFAEVFGMPVRIARYAPNATPEEKKELLTMLKQLGADAAAIFSKAVDVEIKQTRLPGETNIYENLCLYFDREISKAWLGQTLTTDTARVRANIGVAEVHDRVRRDLLEDDLRKEAATLRCDLLAPLTRLRFGPDAPVPYFRRLTNRSQDPEGLARVLSLAVNSLGAKVPTQWAHAALGLPEAREGDAVLPGGR